MQNFSTQFPDFDWKFYRDTYRDLKSHICNEEQAREHYLKFGQFEPRIINANQKHLLKAQNELIEVQRKNFYEEFPLFDWKFYISSYSDLQQLNIKNEQQAIEHYKQHGIKEKRRSHAIIQHKQEAISIPNHYVFDSLKQCLVSSGLSMFEKRFCAKFGFQRRNCFDSPCVFFGIYNDADLENLSNHKGIKYIIWGGEDINPDNSIARKTLQEVRKIPNIIHLAISKSIVQTLNELHIAHIFIEFNLVNLELFKPVKKEHRGFSIYIFNGQVPGREHIYGKEIYEEVMKRLPYYDFILSNQVRIPHEEMPEVYSRCFIMLRLTQRDGNANSVQECEAMNIPVIHNQSDYGIPWKNADDIVTIIKRHSVI